MIWKRAALAWFVLLTDSLGCSPREEIPPAPIRVNQGGMEARMRVLAPEPDEEPTEKAPQAVEPDVPQQPVEPPSAPARVWGRADLDPENDHEVAPPEPVPGCHALLTEMGAVFRPAELPLRQVIDEVPTCGAHDAVTLERGPLGISLRPPAVLTCQMALGILGLEALMVELSESLLGEQVISLHQGGTYSCRRMARFDLVSEHSYGNAIDVYSFTLVSGRKLSVLSHFGRLDAPPGALSKEAVFLRELASAAFDRDLFSVSLSPYWDALHRDHFHFDMARYRVDGTRPKQPPPVGTGN